MTEYATTDRHGAARALLTPELRDQLAHLRAGARCANCSSPASVVRVGRLLCGLCARWGTILRRANEMRAPRA